jgi:hypothetical protein
MTGYDKSKTNNVALKQEQAFQKQSLKHPTFSVIIVLIMVVKFSRIKTRKMIKEKTTKVKKLQNCHLQCWKENVKGGHNSPACRLKDKITKGDWATNKAKAKETPKTTKQSLLNTQSNNSKEKVMIVHQHTKAGVQHMSNSTKPNK